MLHVAAFFCLWLLCMLDSRSWRSVQQHCTYHIIWEFHDLFGRHADAEVVCSQLHKLILDDRLGLCLAAFQTSIPTSTNIHSPLAPIVRREVLFRFI